MGERDKQTLKRIGVAALSVLLIAYIVYQAVQMISEPVETEIAYNYTVEDTVDTEVFVARQENYITNTKPGTIISIIDDGSRVAKNQPVAAVFSSTDEADRYNKLKDLEASIERYERLASQSDNYTFDVNDLNDNIDRSVMKLADVITSGKMVNLQDATNNLRDQVVTRQIAVGDNLDFQSKLTAVKAEYDALSKQKVNFTPINSAQSGYYISGVDGLEKIVDCSQLSKITVDKVYGILKSEKKAVPNGSIGKVVTDFTWYFICNAHSNSIGDLKVGDSITVNLPFSSVNSLNAKVYSINENNGEETALVLSCNLMNSAISTLRRESAELVIDSYSGLKIPASAVRVNDKGESGVFVLKGNMVTFKKINIVYSNDQFVLSATEVGADGYVKLYDNIITGGKDLYDGKIVK